MLRLTRCVWPGVGSTDLVIPDAGFRRAKARAGKPAIRDPSLIRTKPIDGSRVVRIAPERLPRSGDA